MQPRSIVIALAIALGPTAARADDAFADAQALNTQGRALLDAGDPGGALALFQRAYLRSPSVALLLNIGTSYKRLGRNAEAANAYQRYVDDPDADPARVADLRGRIAALDATVGRIALEVDPAADPAAEVQIGDRTWTPAAQVRLVRIDPGTYVIRARLGIRSGEVTGRISAGEQQSQRLVLAVPRATPTSTPPVPLPGVARIAPAAEPGWTRPVAAIAGSAGIAALAGSVVFAVRARGRYGDARALCGEGCGEPRFGQSRALADAAGRDRWWSIGLATGGTVAVAAAAYLWFRPAGDRRAITVVAAPGQLGLVVDRSF